MVSEDAVLYLWFAAAAASSGFTRFLRSRAAWRARIVLSSVLTGALASVAFIGWWYGDTVAENRFQCLAIAIGTGFANPESLGRIWEVILRDKTNQ